MCLKVLVAVVLLSCASAKVCEKDGFFQQETSCKNFYRCLNGLIIGEWQCPENTYFNEEIMVCDHMNAVKCKNENNNGDGNEISTVSEKVTIEPKTTETLASSQTENTKTSSQSWEWHPPIGPTPPTEEMPAESFEDKFKIVCYFTNWAWYRPKEGKFIPEHIHPHYCTHIIYAFAGLSPETLKIKVHDSWADIDNQFFKRVVAMKKRNPKLKILLALGGWNDSKGDKYSRLVNDAKARKEFIDDCLRFLKKYGFDGLDLDWEYPVCWQANCNIGNRNDRQAFAIFVKQLKEAFAEKRYLLTAAVSASKTVIDYGYDVPSLAADLDFINLMAYDYYGAWGKQALHHSPLWAHPENVSSLDGSNAIFNVNFSVNYWLQKGAPAEKIILGVPFYGRGFTLASESAKRFTLASKSAKPFFGFGAKASDKAMAGPYTREGGFLSYYEICDYVKTNGYKKHRISSMDFIANDKEWIGFDDIQSIIEKMNFVKNLKLGGAMVWDLALDDFNGKCCDFKYPLLKTINFALRNIKAFANIKCI